jgi:hypothetical protein
MNKTDETHHRLELLKMARELANEEYINKRAEDHNAWLAQVDVVWRTRGVKLAYPAFVPFPTEAEIVAKAITLYSFVKAPAAPSTDTTIDDAVPQMVVASKAVPSTWDTYVDASIKVAELVVVPMAPAQPEVVAVPEIITEIPVVTEPIEHEVIPEIIVAEPIEPEIAVVEESVVIVPEEVTVLRPLFAIAEPAAIIDAVPDEPTPAAVKKSLLTSWFNKKDIT